MAKKQKSIWDKIFRDKTGKVVLWQNPNIPLTGWAVCKVLAFFINGQLGLGFSLLSSAFIFTWAYLELTKGVNYFRKVIGALVLTSLLIGYFS